MSGESVELSALVFMLAHKWGFERREFDSEDWRAMPASERATWTVLCEPYGGGWLDAIRKRPR